MLGGEAKQNHRE